MKAFLILIALLILPVQKPAFEKGSPSQSDTEVDLPQIDNEAFRVGEFLKYRIHYGIINAGIAELRVEELTRRKGRPVYHIVGEGRTVGMAEWFFRTRDRYETYMDTEAMIPWEFIRDVDEGGFIIKRHLKFDHYSHQVVETIDYPEKSYSSIPFAQDMLSAFYYARSLDTKDLKKGESIAIDMFLDYEDFSFKLRFDEIDHIKTSWGKVRCKKLTPVVQEGRVFSDQEGMAIWVTDDQNKIPVRLEADLLVGKIKMDLIEYDNPMKPIRFTK